jgi:glyoxylase-like metal-dependent hydrolase (beta-lactamase superfamily II)
MSRIYEVFALRYATVERRRRDNFIVVDSHDGPMPMDYFVWLVRGNGRHWLVDTGFNAQAADRRQRHWLRCPVRSLAALNLAPEQVTDVIVTHLHYDHAGNLDMLPHARVHLQDSELQYAVSRYMGYGPLRHAYCADDVCHVVQRLYSDGLVFHDGDAVLADGLELVHVGGHTRGLQAVRVRTARGWVVLASDASHYYDNIGNESPFPIVHDVGAMLEGYRKLLALADSPDHVVPGHDPLVMARYPRHGAGTDEIVALHLEPAPFPANKEQ